MSTYQDSPCANHPQNAIWPRLPIGSRVSGTYHGVPYTGTVHSDRGHSYDWTIRQTDVDLDTPIEVYESTRTNVLIWACGACGGKGTDTTIEAGPPND